MRWTVPLVLVVAASCGSTDEGAGRIGDLAEARTDAVSVGAERVAPPGSRLEDVTELGFGFAVPGDWVTIDPDELDGSLGTPELTELAGRVGVDADTMLGLLDDRIALAVVAPDDASGFVSNLNVVELPTPGLPGRALLEAGLTAAGADVVDADVVERDGWAIVDLRYRLEVGGTEVEGAAAFVEIDGAPISVTVSSTDREEADRVGDLVVGTLARLG